MQSVTEIEARITLCNELMLRSLGRAQTLDNDFIWRSMVDMQDACRVRWGFQDKTANAWVDGYQPPFVATLRTFTKGTDWVVVRHKGPSISTRQKDACIALCNALLTRMLASTDRRERITLLLEAAEVRWGRLAGDFREYQKVQKWVLDCMVWMAYSG